MMSCYLCKCVVINNSQQDLTWGFTCLHSLSQARQMLSTGFLSSLRLYKLYRKHRFNNSSIEECCLMWCYAMWLLYDPTFRRRVVPSSPILVTLMMDETRSYDTSVLTRATWRKIPEDSILHSHRLENLRSYIAITGWAV
jgi:hypothetical protein